MTDPVGVLRQTLKRYLEESYGASEVDADQDFIVRRGSTLTYLRPLSWAGGKTVVRIWSITNIGVPVGGDLTRFLATESGKFTFGGFSLDEDRSTVLFGHTLLGDFLSRKELEEAVDAVSSSADAYDDVIKARFGGRLVTEANVATAPTPAPAGKRGLHRLFALLGVAAAIAAAAAAYRWIDDSWWLTAYAFLLTSYVVSRGVGDLVTDPQKARRAVYFALQPALGTAVLAGTYAAWERWWLAVVLAVVGGGLVAGVVGPLLFPRIHREETADTAQRWRAA
jgi:hypothetical protein